MKIDELIEKLEEIKNNCGNIGVELVADCGNYAHGNTLEDVEVQNDKVFLISYE